MWNLVVVALVHLLLYLEILVTIYNYPISFHPEEDCFVLQLDLLNLKLYEVLDSKHSGCSITIIIYHFMINNTIYT